MQQEGQNIVPPTPNRKEINEVWKTARGFVSLALVTAIGFTGTAPASATEITPSDPAK